MSAFFPDQECIQGWIEHACAANGVPQLANEIGWQWNRRFTARMGDANYARRRIRLSIPLWPRATSEQRRQTVIHEACHIIAIHLYGRIPAHGRHWRAVMRRAGANPARCHTVNREGLAQNRSRYTVYCQCSSHNIGRIKYGRMTLGVRYHCSRCGGPVTIKPTSISA